MFVVPFWWKFYLLDNLHVIKSLICMQQSTCRFLICHISASNINFVVIFLFPLQVLFYINIIVLSSTTIFITNVIMVCPLKRKKTPLFIYTFSSQIINEHILCLYSLITMIKVHPRSYYVSPDILSYNSDIGIYTVV